MIEVYLAIVAFLLHFVWEMWQIPLFSGMSEAPHLEGVYFCTRANARRHGNSIGGLRGAAIVQRSRSWLFNPTWQAYAAYFGIGLAIIIVFEHLATSQGRWEYSRWMPTLAILGTGLAPLAQWLILPLLVLRLTRRLARR